MLTVIRVTLIVISYRLNTGTIATLLRGIALAAIIVVSFIVTATVAPVQGAATSAKKPTRLSRC